MSKALTEFARRHALPPEVLAELPELARRLAEEGGGSSAEDRYEELGLLGAGGMGEVHLALDRHLGRPVAVKSLLGERRGHPVAHHRFVEEARVASRLQHPAIVPIYDLGHHPDGRPWFSMREVRGTTLADAIAALHAASVPAGRWVPMPSGWTFRRLVEALRAVCDAVAYAHAQGVLHRDLKPANVLLGTFGEVYVVDWGLAKRTGATEPVDATPEAPGGVSGAGPTTAGQVLGTPAYMSPEQAQGDGERVGPPADVYGLGATLYELLAGVPPYVGPTVLVWEAVLAGPPAPLPRRLPRDADGGLEVPDELAAACARAMARDPADRWRSAEALAEAVGAWLDGSRRREAATAVVTEAARHVEEGAALRARAAELRGAAAARLAEVRAWQPEEVKAAGWALEDEADALEHAAELAEVRREVLLEGALTHAPDLVEARVALAEIELARHAEAELARDARGVARARARLEEHGVALPASHPVGRRVAAHLSGVGALTLVTDPPGAEVELLRFETRNRRLSPVPRGSLGRTPLRAVALPAGSYLCRIHHPDRAALDYPVCLGRGEHWDGVPPGGTDPRPVRLPRRGEWGPDERVIAAGWSWSGGDPQALSSRPRERVWCDTVVMRRFPVTNREFLAFLDALVASGREEEAERHQPRERSPGPGHPIYARSADGRFGLRPDAEGDAWLPDYPVVCVDWHGASAYAAWWAEVTGRPWGLPREIHHEKAARGVDGRRYPWGDVLDPSWAHISTSHAGPPLPAVVDSYPVDESVYGVRGLAGNVQDWCVDVATAVGESSLDLLTTGGWARTIRGGHWFGTARLARSAARSRLRPEGRQESIGLRLALVDEG